MVLSSFHSLTSTGAIPRGFLSFCCSCSIENILMVLYQNLFGGCYLCSAFHHPLCPGWCHLLHGQLLGLTHLFTRQSTIEHSLHGQRLVLLKDAVLPPVAYNPSTAPIAFGMSVDSILSLSLCCKLSMHVFNACAYQDFCVCCCVCLEHLSRHVFTSD